MAKPIEDYEDQELAHIDNVKGIREAGATLICEIDEDLFFVPLSQIHPDESEVQGPGDSGTLVIPEWLWEAGLGPA